MNASRNTGKRLALLGGLTPRAFLARHWQQRPLLVEGALPAAFAPLDGDDLAGLACRDDVDARLVVRRRGDRLEERSGPFTPAVFRRLPARGWTLLVHEVNRLVPAVGDLLERFRFVPNWRMDDVMVSYAAPGGGVGAHVDRYDVFLVQGPGRRRWRVGLNPPSDRRVRAAAGPPVLRAFRPDREWIAGAGDLLYLPPDLPHEGVAVDACLTFSIGFRVPDTGPLLAALAADVLDDPTGALYADPDLRVPRDPGAVDAAARRRVRRVLRAVLDDDARLDRCLARVATTPRRLPDVAGPARPVSAAALRAHLAAGGSLRRSSPSHFAWIHDVGGRARLVAGGEEHRLDAALAFTAPLLTGRRPLTAATLRPHLRRKAFVALVLDLIDQGYLVLLADKT